MAYYLRSEYGYVFVENTAISDLLLPAVAMVGAGSLAAALNVADASLNLPAVTMTGAGSLAVGALNLTDSVLSLPAVALTGAGSLAAALNVTSVWSPLDLGAKLKFWVRPEGSKYTTTGRTILQTTVGNAVGSWTDESGNNNHIGTAAGSKPTLKANGGLSFNSNFLVSLAAIGAWSADFAAGYACKVTTHVATAGVLTVEYATGFNTMLDASSGNIVTGVGNPAPPYGHITQAFSLSTPHTVRSSRVGTTFSTSIDGGTAATATVTGAALANTALYVASNQYTNLIGDIDEVVIVDNPTSGEIASLDAYLAARKMAGAYTLERTSIMIPVSILNAHHLPAFLVLISRKPEVLAEFIDLLTEAQSIQDQTSREDYMRSVAALFDPITASEMAKPGKLRGGGKASPRKVGKNREVTAIDNFVVAKYTEEIDAKDPK